jgi:hypothetical protein
MEQLALLASRDRSPLSRQTSERRENDIRATRPFCANLLSHKHEYIKANDVPQTKRTSNSRSVGTK